MVEKQPLYAVEEGRLVVNERYQDSQLSGIALGTANKILQRAKAKDDMEDRRYWIAVLDV